MDDIDMDHVSALMAFVDIPSVSRQIYHLIRRIVIIGPIRRRIVLLGHLERLSYIKSKKRGKYTYLLPVDNHRREVPFPF